MCDKFIKSFLRTVESAKFIFDLMPNKMHVINLLEVEYRDVVSQEALLCTPPHLRPCCKKDPHNYPKIYHLNAYSSFTPHCCQSRFSIGGNIVSHALTSNIFFCKQTNKQNKKQQKNVTP